MLFKVQIFIQKINLLKNANFLLNTNLKIKEIINILEHFKMEQELETLQSLLRAHYSKHFHLLIAYINSFFIFLALSVIMLENLDCSNEGKSLVILFIIESFFIAMIFIYLGFGNRMREKIIEAIWISEFAIKFSFLLSFFIFYSTDEQKNECNQIVIFEEILLLFYSFIVLNFILFAIILTLILLVKRIRRG